MALRDAYVEVFSLDYDFCGDDVFYLL